ncbi:MAG: hypothetical protein IKW00_02700 [Clostridia bacterium]|nr:hypothetical protein [Clostridia bacterium]
MRKFLVALLLLMTVCLSAGAELQMKTEKTDRGQITYVTADDDALNELLSSHLGIADALILLRSGTEITGKSDLYLFEKDGVSYASLRFIQQGKIRFGRYGQTVETVLINLTEGSEASLDSVFSDMDGLSSRLDLYVEETVLPQLNTYLDAAELLPVPLENIYLSHDGLTVHYPSDRFSFFSGNSGAVEIKYFELELENEGIGAAGEGDVLTLAAEGKLFGVGQVSLDMTLESVLNAFGGLNESDFIVNGEIYEVEEPSLRGVSFIMARDADTGERLKGIRSQRLDMQGLKTGVSTRKECINALGKPRGSALLDPDTAESYRIAEGMLDVYTAGEYDLILYYDVNDVLSAVEIAR